MLTDRQIRNVCQQLYENSIWKKMTMKILISDFSEGDSSWRIMDYLILMERKQKTMIKMRENMISISIKSKQRANYLYGSKKKEQ